jgi:hypothetical protein
MPTKVPYLREEQIERSAAALLAEYEQARGVRIDRPIPIEDIVEKHLKLGIEFDDLHKKFGVPRSGLEPDILGVIFFDECRVVINEALDPEENPSKECRYRFTFAHEGGAHWRLHRYLFAKDPMQGSMFNEPTEPTVVCRSSEARKPVEWQADVYASCLLTPRKLVLAAWNEMLAGGKPRVIQPRIAIKHPFVEIPRLEWQIADLDCSNDGDRVWRRRAAACVRGVRRRRVHHQAGGF